MTIEKKKLLGVSNGDAFKTDGSITNEADRMDEAMAQSGHRVVASAATGEPTAGKVFVAIMFPQGGSFTSITDTALLAGDPTTITYPAGGIYFGKVTSYQANAITDAVEGV